MTLRQLFDTPWSAISDYPNIGYPHRATRLAFTEWRNDYEVRFEASVYTNRTHNRFWLEIVYGDPRPANYSKPTNRTLNLYLTTTSKRKAEAWQQAVTNGIK